MAGRGFLVAKVQRGEFACSAHELGRGMTQRMVGKGRRPSLAFKGRCSTKEELLANFLF
jgi:hypothetical protein